MGSFFRLVTVCGLTLLAFGCASEKTRYAENPFFASSRFDPKTTGSLTPVQDPAPLFPKAPIGMASNNAAPVGSSQPHSQSQPTSSQSPIAQQELQPLASQTISAQPQISRSTAVQGSSPQTLKQNTNSPSVVRGQDAKFAAGMVIPVKGGKWAADGGAMVTLGDGESLSTIANRYGVPENALRKMNGFTPTAKPIPGTRLLIPVFISDTASNLTGKTQPSTSQAALAQPSPVDQSQMQKVPPVSKSSVQNFVNPQDKTASLGTAPTAAVDVTTEANSTAATEQAGVEKTIATTGFRWPARGRVIASFGETNGVKNAGINIALPQGTPVKAAESGVVAYAGNEVKGQGNLVMIRHADGWVSIYANNSELKVKRGDEVKRGQVVALSGQTGDVPSPQLHFELRKGSTPVDPVAHLSDD